MKHLGTRQAAMLTFSDAVQLKGFSIIVQDGPTRVRALTAIGR